MDQFNTESNVSEQGTNQVVESTEQANQTPQEVEIKADGLYRLPGQNKAVKWDDYYKGFQGKLTTATQEASRLRSEYAKSQQQIQEANRRIQEYENAQRLASVNRSKGETNEFTQALRALPYLRGEEAVQLYERLAGEFSNHQNALNQRDTVILALAQELGKIKNQFAPLLEAHSGSVFEGKIDKFLKELDLGDDSVAKNLAKEIYLAYEGDDLDAEFPNIFRDRWNSLEEGFAKRAKAKVDAAKKAPFVPGRGGLGTPSRPLQSKGNESAREIAERMWPGEFSKT